MWAELNIGGAWVCTPRVWEDNRGSFFEMFHGQEFDQHLGYQLEVAQVNCSVSRRGVIRGIHFADVPPGQAKYVCCVSGSIVDVVVDLRVGSPTFKAWEAVEMDGASGRALFLAEGLGHGFTAASPEATVVYLCSTPYAPGRERTVHALDPGLGIAWPDHGAAILSDRDAAAPTLEQARAGGLLPSYEACLEWGRSLSSGEPLSR
ncbi:MAG TPA: dTDP-4-dehydrorhamnose 3,5-epimerase [Streptosporangiaceae bacterium]